MVNTSNFSKRLQKVLDFYGLSATSFSEEVAVNRSTISHLLSGRNKPSLEFVMKVLQTYPEVELYWLLNGKGNFPSTSKKTTIVSNTHKLLKDTPDDLLKKNTAHAPVSENSVFENVSEKKTNTAAIERIVVFYHDGTFKEYNNVL
jgi:transcriptional regulator with XRE-family HTH domain